MAYTALLDACVLYPPTLRDLLLRLGERRLYRPLWSAEILEEMVGSILRDRPDLTAERLARTVDLMREFFPDAEVIGYAGLVEAMANERKDRHVLAAAVKGRADVIVTRNLRHFPLKVLEPFDLDVQGPDDFLLHQFYLQPEIVLAELEGMASTNKQPPRTMSELLERLDTLAPEFSQTVRDHLAE